MVKLSIKLIRTENILMEGEEAKKFDKEVVDFDRYVFESKSGLSTKDISVVVDFEDNEISGDMVAYGDWFDLTQEECIEYLSTLEEHQILRDFSDIVNQYEEELEYTRDVQAIIGSSEHGELPFIVSEALEYETIDMVIYAFDTEEALDLYVTYGEEHFDWHEEDFDCKESENENIVYAKGYFPLNLDYVSVKELDNREVEMIEQKFNNKKKVLGKENEEIKFE